MATNLAIKTIQIPEGALDELFVGRYWQNLFVREELKINLNVANAMSSHGITANHIPENMITVPANWYQRAAWNGTTTIKSKNIPAGLMHRYDTTPRQAFGRESNQLMLSRQGWHSNSQRFKANYEGWLASKDGQEYWGTQTPTPWTDIDTWAQIMFAEFDQATQNYINKKLTPIEP